MHLPLTLALRPGRAAALSALAALVSLSASALLLVGSPAGRVAAALTAVVLVVAAVTLGGLCPPVGRRARIGLVLARAGLVTAAVAQLVSSASGLAPVSWAAVPALALFGAGALLLAWGMNASREPHGRAVLWIAVGAIAGAAFPPGLAISGAAWAWAAACVRLEHRAGGVSREALAGPA